MKLKLLAFLLCLVMLASVGCGETPAVESDTETDPPKQTDRNQDAESESESESESETEADAPETEANTETDTETETEKDPEITPPAVPTLSDYSAGSSVGMINIATASGAITGANNVTIPRPDQSGRVISAADYISPDNTSTQNVTGFANLLAAVKESYADETPITMIDVPTGTYRFKSSKQYAIHLKGMVNLVIEGNGSQFIFEDSDRAIGSAAFFGLENCDTVELRNFSVDFDWDIYPLFVIGEVISSDTSNNSVTFRIDSHKLPDKVTIGGGRTWDPNLDNRSETVGFVPSGSVSATEVLDDHTLRVTYSSAKSAQNARAGQCFQFYFKPNFNASGFRMYYNKNVTLNGITIYSTPYEAAWSAVSDGYHIIDCKVIPAEGRRFSTYSGFETHAVKGQVIMEGCELYGILDDNMHLSNHFMGGENVKIDDYTMEFRNLQTWSTKYYFYEGATIGWYDDEYYYLGWSSTIESVSYVLEGKNDMATYTVKFKDPLPKYVKTTDKFFSEDFYNGSYIIRNNTFFGGLCHALYIGLGNGTIENNTFDNFAYPSLVLTTVTRWGRWHIGVDVQNVVIRNNVMTRCNTAKRDPASLAIAAGRDENPSDFYPVDNYVIKNVLVENNVVDGSTGSAFALFSAEDIIVRNNQFLNSNTLPTTKLRRVGWGNAYICNAQNVTWENNLIQNNATSFEYGLFVEWNTVKNVKVK